MTDPIAPDPIDPDPIDPGAPAGNAAEPIAVVGLACRLPGAAGPDALWQLLDAGGCAISDVPADRFPVDDWYDPTPRPGAISSKRGGFLDGVRDFDADFFGMSRREAVRTDPRQRLLLETGWEAVEDAGWSAGGAATAGLGVWVSGCMVSEYWDLLRESGDADLHAAFGAGMFGAAPGRLSHLLDARGPSVAIDATCAGGLVAVHLAMASLRSGEAGAALVAGVNLVLGPDNSAALSSGGVLSPGGLCRFGDSAADGYVRAEGVVAVVLKPLARAHADGDRVRAVLLGSGTSHDGRSSASRMSPGVDGQVAALRAAYRDADTDPAEVSYVEAHGTGTSIGDRVELTALGRVLGARRPADRPCAVGSLKSNVGHTEAAAGLAGLLKVVLALEHGRIPATLHVTEPNEVLTAGSGLDLAVSNRPWPVGRRPVAGVSSFGLSGANAHVVLAAAPAAPASTPVPAQVADRPVLVPLSAVSGPAVAALAESWSGLDADPVDLAHTAARHRTHHPVRAAALVEDGARSPAALREAATRSVVSDGRPRVAFVLPGQGGQWPGMTADLLDASPVYADALAECDAALRPELGWSLLERLRERRELRGVDVVQPCLWAVGVGLAAVWRDWGVRPDVVIGHSMGEVTAATVSGALTVRDGAAVVSRRSRLLAGLGSGAMALVHLGVESARELIESVPGRLTIAAVNSSSSVVVAGDEGAVEMLLAEVVGRGAFCRRVAVDFASHSPHVDPVLGPLRDVLSDLRPRAGDVPMHSTLLDQTVDGSGCDAGYWADNLRRPVRFADAVRAAVRDGRPTFFVELSPHPTMIGAIDDERDLLDAPGGSVGSLHRDEPWTVLLRAAGTAYAHGCDLNWDRVNPAGRRLALPAYPWQRERFWPTPAAPQERIDTGSNAPADPGTAAAAVRRTRDLPPHPDGTMAAVLAALPGRHPGRQPVLEDVRVERDRCAGPLVLEVEQDPDHVDGGRFTVRRGTDAPDGFVAWTPVAAGSFRVARSVGSRRIDVAAVQRRCVEPGPLDAPRPTWRRDGEALTRLRAGSDAGAAVVETLLAAHGRDGGAPSGPIEADECRLHPGARPAWCLAWSRPTGSGPVGDVLLLDADGEVVGRWTGVSPAGGESGHRAPAAASPAAAPRPAQVASRPDRVAEQLADAVGETLQIPRERLDLDAPLGGLGLDSLLAAEVRRAMARHRVDVPARVLLDGSAIADVARRLASRRTDDERDVPSRLA